MQKPKGLFWLASYPKSGNTWFRIVLANLLNSSEEPITLNQLQTGEIASSRHWIDDVLGFDSADLDYDELDELRPAIYEWRSEHTQKVNYHKIHDAYTYLKDKTPLIPSKGCLGALYFIRNPLDVAVSFANHANCSIDKTIDCMNRPNYAFCKNKFRQHIQTRQWLLSWSLHVKSWTTTPHINVLTIRYEDMKLNPVATFSKAINFLNLQVSQEKLEQAIDNARIEKLQQQEEEAGFHERPANVRRFFRKGIPNDWQATLTAPQIDSIIQHHRDIMRQYGYLDANNKPYVFPA